MNKEQAERALEVGARAFQAGDMEKAVRFFEKSISMYPSAKAEGLLARAKSAAAAKNTNSAPSPSPSLRKRTAAAQEARKAEPQRDLRPHTPEQAALVRKIKSCKDLYAMLGIARGASDADIKKAYRKMAIKCHPDKNSAPGADEAFKDVNKAFSILSDPQKRAEYDQFGSTSDGPAQQFTRRYHQDDFDPAEIFREVFGAGFMNGGNVRTYHFGGGAGNGFRQPRQQQERDRQGSLLQLLPLLLLFLMSFTSMPSQTQSVFSLSKTSQFPMERKTMTAGIVPDIPYFVDGQFGRAYGRDYRKLQSLESQVQAIYVRSVESKCQKDRVLQRQRAERARRAGDSKRYKAILEADLPACNEWDRVNAYISP